MNTVTAPARSRVFFVDDDPKAGGLWLRYFRGSPYDCRVFRDPREALERFRIQPADLVITDLRMPHMGGIQLLEAIKSIDSQVPVIVITAYGSLDSAIDALRLGATDFIKKPYDMEELEKQVARILGRSREFVESASSDRSSNTGLHYGMVGDSDAMNKVYRAIQKLAGAHCSIFIHGESGTGKELAARAIHNAGPRFGTPFVVVDCGGITDSLLESELFGHRRGAFTGADRDREGLLRTAGEGTGRAMCPKQGAS